MRSTKTTVILMSTFTAVSLALALLFSHLRSFDHQNVLEQLNGNLSVDFNSKIKNARNIVNVHYTSDKQSKTLGTDNIKKNSKKSTLTSSSILNVNNESFESSHNHDSIYRAANNNLTDENNEALKSKQVSLSTVNTNPKLTGVLAKNAPKINVPNGVVSLNSDLSKAQNAGNKFNADAPPPSEDELPPSLPIGDGMTYMLVMAIALSVFKAMKIGYLK